MAALAALGRLLVSMFGLLLRFVVLLIFIVDDFDDRDDSNHDGSGDHTVMMMAVMFLGRL